MEKINAVLKYAWGNDVGQIEVHVTQPLVPQQSFNKVGVCILNLIALW
jgi:hypothetical protein